MISKPVANKTLRSYAQDRLLSDMVISSDREASSKGMQPTGYILVLDDYTLQIVNSVVQMKDLIDQKIVGIERVELKRKPFPKMHAIYFLEPNAANLKFINEDAQAKTYGSIHMYFTRNIPDTLFQNLRAMPEVLAKLLSFKELNLDFHVVDDCLFHLSMRGIFNQLYLNKDQAVLAVTAEKLYTLVSVFLPTSNLQLVTETGTVGDAVGQMVMSQFKSIHAKHKEIVDPQMKPIRLLVLDRSFDIKAATIHDFHYQAMCQDLADIRNNTVEYETDNQKGERIKRKSQLDENDELWVNYRFKHIAQVSAEHSEK